VGAEKLIDLNPLKKPRVAHDDHKRQHDRLETIKNLFLPAKTEYFCKEFKPAFGETLCNFSLLSGFKND